MYCDLLLLIGRSLNHPIIKTNQTVHKTRAPPYRPKLLNRATQLPVVSHLVAVMIEQVSSTFRAPRPTYVTAYQTTHDDDYYDENRNYWSLVWLVFFGPDCGGVTPLWGTYSTRMSHTLPQEQHLHTGEHKGKPISLPDVLLSTRLVSKTRWLTGERRRNFKHFPTWYRTLRLLQSTASLAHFVSCENRPDWEDANRRKSTKSKRKLVHETE